jgi:hypothetical protein
VPEEIFTRVDDSQIDTLHIGISPDKRWFSYYRPQAASNNYELWLSSIDGQTRSLIASDFPYQSSYVWLGTQTMLVFWYVEPPTETSLGVMTTLQVKPLAGESHILTDVVVPVPYDSSEVSRIYAFSPDSYQLIDYNISTTEFRLHDYITKESREAFPGVERRQISKPKDVYLQWTASGISMAFIDNEGLEVALNQSPDSVAQTNVFLQQQI